MCVKTCNRIFCIVMFILNIRTTAVRLYPCDRGYHDVEENTIVTFHCDQYSDKVLWQYVGPNIKLPTPISTCNATLCTIPDTDVWNSTFISAGNSSVTTALISRDVRVAGGKYKCGNQTCKVHIIVPASVSQPTSFLTGTDQGYSLNCQTRIVKVYSSEGHYSCVWQNGRTQVNGTLNLQPPPDNTTNTSDRMGTCNATLQLSSISDAICNVTVSPGNTFASSGIEANASGEDAQSVIIIGLSIGWGATVVCFVVIFVVIKRQRKGAAKERPRTQSFKPSVQHNVVRSDVSIIARTAGESRDNLSFGAYESLQSADVGQTSVYSEMTHGSGSVYGNSSTPNK